MQCEMGTRILALQVSSSFHLTLLTEKNNGIKGLLKGLPVITLVTENVRVSLPASWGDLRSALSMVKAETRRKQNMSYTKKSYCSKTSKTSKTLHNHPKLRQRKTAKHCVCVWFKICL